jgi:hypothetical protein
MKIDDLPYVFPFSGLWDEFYGDSQNASRKNDLGQISKTI